MRVKEEMGGRGKGERVRRGGVKEEMGGRGKGERVRRGEGEGGDGREREA